MTRRELLDLGGAGPRTLPARGQPPKAAALTTRRCLPHHAANASDAAFPPSRVLKSGAAGFTGDFVLDL